MAMNGVLLRVCALMMATAVVSCSGADGQSRESAVESVTAAQPLSKTDPGRAEDRTDKRSKPSVAQPADSRKGERDPLPGEHVNAPSTPTYSRVTEVDFENDFTYINAWHNGSPVVVTDGRFSSGAPGGDDYFSFEVRQLAFGDLDGDGLDEAVVVTTWNGGSGGSSMFDRVSAYRLVDGDVVAAGTVPFGDRSLGGIRNVSIEDGAVAVTSFSSSSPDGVCCQNLIVNERLVLDTELMRREPPVARSLVQLQAEGPTSALQFLSGATSGVVELPAEADSGTFSLRAGEGQRIRFDVDAGEAPEHITIVSLDTGEAYPVSDTFVLPASGVYEVTVLAETGHRRVPTRLEVGIDPA